MKRLLNILVLIILSFSLVSAATDSPQPSPTITESDKDKVDQLINNIPIDEGGNFKPGILNPVKSKAEQKVDAINKWLEDNTPWLSIIFGMTPAISWLFAVNLYFMILFLVILVFNSGITLGFLSGKKPFIFGLALYIILLGTKVYVMLSKLVLNLIQKVWADSWIWGILIVIVLIALVAFAPKLLYGIGKLFKKDKMKEVLEKAEVDEKVLEARARGI